MRVDFLCSQKNAVTVRRCTDAKKINTIALARYSIYSTFMVDPLAPEVIYSEYARGFYQERNP